MLGNSFTASASSLATTITPLRTGPGSATPPRVRSKLAVYTPFSSVTSILRMSWARYTRRRKVSMAFLAMLVSESVKSDVRRSTPEEIVVPRLSVAGSASARVERREALRDSNGSIEASRRSDVASILRVPYSLPSRPLRFSRAAVRSAVIGRSPNLAIERLANWRSRKRRAFWRLVNCAWAMLTASTSASASFLSFTSCWFTSSITLPAKTLSTAQKRWRRAATASAASSAEATPDMMPCTRFSRGAMSATRS
mmetsp:Transcript_7137/g.13034  ORF Transcript_7137/g.13034 Transcript_7137/m.13034 type:complete len:254 (-) Transcript_7137:1811-2572(-)